MDFGFYQAKMLSFACKIFTNPTTGVSLNGKFI